MSMTWEEPIVNLEKLIALFHTASEQSKMVDYSKIIETLEFAAAALRPVSRELVEKVWRGCKYCKKHKIKLVRIEMDYNETPGSPERLNPTRVPKFCPICGRPLTDEAVEMVMERINKMEGMENEPY